MQLNRGRCSTIAMAPGSAAWSRRTKNWPRSAKPDTRIVPANGRVIDGAELRAPAPDVRRLPREDGRLPEQGHGFRRLRRRAPADATMKASSAIPAAFIHGCFHQPEPGLFAGLTPTHNVCRGPATKKLYLRRERGMLFEIVFRPNRPVRLHSGRFPLEPRHACRSGVRTSGSRAAVTRLSRNCISPVIGFQFFMREMSYMAKIYVGNLPFHCNRRSGPRAVRRARHR